ncbi:MAG TPA: DHA2 family efflux MFS transporter permease subunit [Candidatus Binataceae bacterium]|nr:DHA2 family efflux MFS transporter permease subunit [Candidatus Binataceae bacterium]
MSEAARNEVAGVARWAGFLAMCAGMFMAILDIQIVASSLPNIQVALSIPLDRLSWVQTAYLIAEIVAIPLTSQLTRLLSMSGLFAAAMLGFVAASLGCGLSGGFAALVSFRVIEGFCGGMLIPTVFTAVFTLFPERNQVLATAVAGVFAVIGPTLGPTVGGYITENFSWHWLFFVNFVPGLIAAVIVLASLPARSPDWGLWRKLDYAGVAALAFCLAALEIGLKEGPHRGWSSGVIVMLFIVFAVCGATAVWRCRTAREPILHLTPFSQARFTIACLYSFILGAGLYGSVYLLPLFLGLVRRHTPLEIGEIMIVGGVAQLCVAPVAAFAEKRFDPRLLIPLGYGLFAGGLYANSFATIHTDFAGLVWPQLLRGAGVMLCLLPTTRLALDGRKGSALTDASALFNLMRNLGGAIGIAAIDTIIEQAVPIHADALMSRLQAGDASVASAIGLPASSFANVPVPLDAAARQMLAPLIQRAAYTQSFNEAWLGLGVVFALSLFALPLLRRPNSKVDLE